ncbi:hypothetical protein TrLO_g8254 [Triparma laevis f. longispina]|uniref:Uncharacterized protein n=1 Tax=Triparma laevis f. longispina TaxID=1714387 RepID=A0A9W7F8V1_9STRA|nr:hypothetical protein TrLO_g8254 [Triparma laevis f. longispina]
MFSGFTSVQSSTTMTGKPSYVSRAAGHLLPSESPEGITAIAPKSRISYVLKQSIPFPKGLRTNACDAKPSHIAQVGTAANLFGSGETKSPGLALISLQAAVLEALSADSPNDT